MIKHWSILAAATVAALALGGAALAQTNTPGGQKAAPIDKASSMTTPQVAAMVNGAKHSLTDSVGAAERQCGGRAVRAECCPDAGAGPVCMVTLLVGDKRLVEATVNTQSGEIISQRDVDTLSFAAMPHHGMAGDGDFAMAQRWQKVTDLRGKKVTNSAGEDLGQIEEIVTDANSGRILYGVLSFGGFLGMGDKLFAIPWNSLELTDDSKGFTLNVEKDRLTNATGFPKDRWPDLANEQFATTTYQYYDQKPYWRTPTGDVQLAADSSVETKVSDRARWSQRTTAWQKCSDLCGKDVRTVQTDDVGLLQNIVVDPDSGRVLYGILSYRGKLFAIPWSALSLNADAKQFVLHAETAQLADSVSFKNSEWPDLTNKGWATDLYAHYHVEPYWVTETR